MPDSRLFYIASPPYSGSTLLSRLLHAHSQLYSVGELQIFSSKMDRRELLTQRVCACGAPTLMDCPFWQSVDHFLKEQYQLSLWTIDLNAPAPEDFKRHNAAFFDALRQTGAPIVVDSSKNVPRLRRLKEAGFNPQVIRLQRPAPGMVNSSIKRGKPWLRAILHYWAYYQNLYGVMGKNVTAVQYEQLARHPRRVLGQLMQQLGLELEEQQLSWAEVTTHYASGNLMRYQKDSRIQLDDKWKTELPRWKAAAVQSLMLIDRLPARWQYGLHQFFLGGAPHNKKKGHPDENSGVAPANTR